MVAAFTAGQKKMTKEKKHEKKRVDSAWPACLSFWRFSRYRTGTVAIYGQQMAALLGIKEVTTTATALW